MTWTSLLSGRKKPLAPDGSKPQLVILIHGTGAGDADPVNPKWWQPESDYAKDLRTRLGPGFDVGESSESAPFKWSGANSERDRRKAGAYLKERLRALDKQGRSYHLIGHSHGGSVIWHALWQLASRKERPCGLKSWTTVGTPFLEFAPVWTGVTTFVPLAIAAFLTFLVAKQALTAAPEYEIIVRDGSAAGIAITILVGLVLLALFLALAIAGARWLGQWSARRRQLGKEKWAISRFAETWLGLWHPEDEPIAGLNASLISPMEFVPRLAKPTSNIFWRILTWPFNRLAAPATDEFVWALLMGRLQGSDLAGASMVDAGAAPRALAPGWAALPDALVKDMTDSAGVQAPRTVAALRAKLARMRSSGSGREAVSELSSAVTWSEVLHTSYFDIPSVRELIAARIALSGRAASTDAPTAAPTALDAWLTQRPRAEAANWPQPFTPILLSFAKVGIFGGLAMLLFTAWTAAYDAYIGPHTRDGQLSILADRATKGETIAGRDVQMLGDMFAQLDMLGKFTKPPLLVLAGIGDSDSRGWAAQRLAYHYGFEGRFDDVRLIADHLPFDIIPFPSDARAFAYIHGLAGARAADKKPDAAFLDTVATRARLVGATAETRDSAGLIDEEAYYSWPWVAVALPDLIHFQHQPTMAIAEKRVLDMLNSNWLDPEVLPRLLQGSHFDCESIAALTALVAPEKVPRKATDALAYCKDLRAPAATQAPPKPLPSAEVVPTDAAATSDVASASTGTTCPTDAELDIVPPRVGELHFIWNQSVGGIRTLLQDGCLEAAAAKLRRHLPTPVGRYHFATPGHDLLALAKLFRDAGDETTAKLIAKYNLPLAPQVVIPEYSADPQFDHVNERACLGFCSVADLKAAEASYQDAVSKRGQARAKDTLSMIGRATRSSIEDTYELLASAIILADLGHKAVAARDARSALFTVFDIEPVVVRYKFAALIGVFAYPLDKALGMQALAVSGALAYWSDLESAEARKTRLQRQGLDGEDVDIEATVAKSAHHMVLADWYVNMGEYRLARESAEQATDKIVALPALGTATGVVAAYSNIVAKASRDASPKRYDAEFLARRPRLISFRVN
jgi:hypothetical protein